VLHGLSFCLQGGDTFFDWSVVTDVTKHSDACHEQGGGTADQVQPRHTRPKFYDNLSLGSFRATQVSLQVRLLMSLLISFWEVSELRGSLYRFDC